MRYGKSMSEALAEVREGFSKKEIKMAIGVASDPRYKGGNYTGAFNAIEKIKKGLAKHPQVAAVLKRQNEEIFEKVKCPHCEGEGCPKCEGKGYMADAVDKEDEPFLKDLIKNLRKGSATHSKQADDLEKAVKEDGHADVSSAMRQCKTITEDATEIDSKLRTMSPEDNLPTWWTNKLAVASNSMNKMRDYIVNPIQEETELDEGYEKEVLLILKDAGISGSFRSGRLYVDKQDVKDAKSALKDSDNIKSLPRIVGEETELDEQFDFVLLDKDNKIVARASGKNAKKEMESSKKSAHLPPMRIPKNEVGKMKIVPINPKDKKGIGDMVLAIGEEVELDEDKSSAVYDFDRLIKDGGLDKRDFRKAKNLYVSGKLMDLRKFIYNLDTSPLEAIMDVIAKNDPKAFMKMYPKSKKGEYMSSIAYAHKEEVELDKSSSLDEGKMKGLATMAQELDIDSKDVDKLKKLMVIYTRAMKLPSGSPKADAFKREIAKLRKDLNMESIEVEDLDAVVVESWELDEMKMDDPKLLKIFDKLKKGSTVKIKIDSAVSKGKDYREFTVTAKNIVGKGKRYEQEKITLKAKDNPTGVKHFLYNRDGKVTLAIGDMGASIADIKEDNMSAYTAAITKGVK